MSPMALRVEKRMLPYVPWGLLGAVLLVSLIGIWNLASAGRNQSVHVSQAIYLGVGVLAMMAVAAVDSNLQRASFSCVAMNPNGGEVNIAGPGVAVYSSTKMPARYATMNGTSMALMKPRAYQLTPSSPPSSSACA